MLVLLLVLPPLVLLALSAILPLLHDRYLAFAAPAFVVLVAWGIASLPARARAVAALLVWLAAILILSAVAAGAARLLEAGLLALAGDKPSLLVPTIAALLVIELAIAATVAFVGFNSHCVIVARLYLDACGVHGVFPFGLTTPPQVR